MVINVKKQSFKVLLGDVLLRNVMKSQGYKIEEARLYDFTCQPIDGVINLQNESFAKT